MNKFFLFAFIIFITSCYTQQVKPDWVEKKWQDTATTLYFSSYVDDLASASDAQKTAINNVNSAIANYSIVYTRSSISEKTKAVQRGGNDKAKDSYTTNINIETESYSDLILSGVKVETYIEAYKNNSGKQKYKAWAYGVVDKKQADQAAANLAKKISEQYANLLTSQGDLYNAIRSYGTILDALDKNPLRKAIAYYDKPNAGGRVELYDYVDQQLNIIASSVSFAYIKNQSVQKTDSFDTVVQLNSQKMKNLGPLDCSVAVYGTNNSSPIDIFKLRADNAFPVKILSKKLNPGKYSVRLELLLNEISRNVAKNPNASFFLEVVPPGAEIEYRGTSLSNGEKTTLFQSLQQGAQSNNVAVRLNAPAGGAQNRYGFVVTLNIDERFIAYANSKTFNCDVTLAFVCNGSVLRQSETKRFVEISRSHVFTQVASFIQGNRQFFSGIKEILE